jgi:four helix bundle protein
MTAETRPPTSTPFLPRQGLRVRGEAAWLAQLVFESARAMPRGERGDLADQMRRAATSVYANLSEGEGKHARAERLRFFEIAWASLRELESHLALATAMALLPPDQVPRLRACTRHVGRMLHALLRSLHP